MYINRRMYQIMYLILNYMMFLSDMIFIFVLAIILALVIGSYILLTMVLCLNEGINENRIRNHSHILY